MATIIRSKGLIIEAEAVIAAVKAPSFTIPGANAIGAPEIRFLKSGSDSDRSVQFFLEAGGNFIWIAESSDEVDRVLSQIAAAKVGIVLNHFTAVVRKTEYSDGVGWQSSETHIPVDADTPDAARDEVTKNFPGNSQTRKFEVIEIIHGEQCPF